MSSLIEQHLGYIILGVFVGLALGYLVAKVYFLSDIRRARRHAVRQSKSVVMGHVSETMAPILPDFPYHFKDVMFLGKGVDYVVFDGLYSGELREIVFLEIKTGQSRLNKNERMIRDCIRGGYVSYDILRL